MEKPLSDNEYIEQFLDGSMPESQRESFLSRIATDPALAEKIKERQLLQEAWTEAHLISTEKIRIASIVQDEKHQSRKRMILKIAASLAVLLTMGSMFYFFNFKSTTYQDVAEKTPLEEDKVIQGMTNQPDEFASVDSVTIAKNRVAPESPAMNAVFTSNDTIRFSLPPTAKDLTLTLIRIENKQSFSFSINKGNTVYLLPTKQLPLGSYSWRMEGHELLGRFSIQK